MHRIDEIIANKANMTEEEFDKAILEETKNGFSFEWFMTMCIAKHGMDFSPARAEIHTAADMDIVRMAEIYRQGREDERNGSPDPYPKNPVVNNWKEILSKKKL